ncbi:MAG: hypothetical protein ACT4N5_06355 [Nitrosopumilaceae archaeon]
MNLKGILVVGFIIGIIALVAVLSSNNKDTRPGLGDSPAITDEVLLNSNLQPQENPSLNDTSTIEKSSGSNYYIDEKGFRHYVIKAEDTVKTDD